MVAPKIGSISRNQPAHRQAIRPIAKPAAILQLLAAALNRPPLLAAMGTCDASGHSRVRMVVIRKVDKAGATVYACTDFHSAKINDIDHSSQGELCFWLPESRVQIRLLVRWTVLNMRTLNARNKKSRNLLQNIWAGLSPASRRLFECLQPDSINLTKDGRNPFQNTRETPPMNFAILAGQILAIDALSIMEPAHVRFSHRKTGNRWKTTRTAP